MKRSHSAVPSVPRPSHGRIKMRRSVRRATRDHAGAYLHRICRMSTVDGAYPTPCPSRFPSLRSLTEKGHPTSDPMSTTIPFRRSAPAMQKRQTKAQLLPMPRAVADELALLAHLSLEALRAGSSDIAPARQMAEVVLVARFMAEAGHGYFPDDAFFDADAIMTSVFDAGQRSGCWSISGEEVERLAPIVSLYDHQLRRATLGALTVASARLEQFKAGESYRGLQKRRA